MLTPISNVTSRFKIKSLLKATLTPKVSIIGKGTLFF